MYVSLLCLIRKINLYEKLNFVRGDFIYNLRIDVIILLFSFLFPAPKHSRTPTTQFSRENISASDIFILVSVCCVLVLQLTLFSLFCGGIRQRSEDEPSGRHAKLLVQESERTHWSKDQRPSFTNDFEGEDWSNDPNRTPCG